VLNPAYAVPVMVTVDRPGGVNYVHRSIKSLTETGFFKRFSRLHLVLGCPSSGYVECYRDDPQIVIHEMSEAEKAEWQGLHIQSKCAYGHLRMIKLLRTMHDWQEALFLEDDIIFAQGWLPYLDVILDEIQMMYGRLWMLTLYQHYGTKKEYAQNKRWYPIWLMPDRPYYHGGLAELHTREGLEGMEEALLSRSIRKFELPSDYVMGDFIFDKKGEVLATAPSLVQHIGKVSTGQSGLFHQADLFMASVG